MASRLSLALLAAAVSLAGCGNAGDDAVRGVTGRFVDAEGSGNGEAACAQLSPQTRAELEKSEQRQCSVAVTHLRLKPGGVARVEVYVMNAMVELTSGETEFLEQGKEGWRLTAVGCTSRGGKPADQPYDCQLQD
jgi:hypothetical protein